MKTFLLTMSMVLALCLGSAGCATHQVTVENSREGKVAVYATKVVDATASVTTAVKKLEAAGTLPTAQAAAVIKTAVELDGASAQLADLLAMYDSTTPGSPQTDLMGRIQDQLTRMGNLASVILVPIADEQVRTQVATLVGALNQSVITLSLELAKGVR